MKKQLVASLAAAMVLGVAGTSFAAANPFADVPAKHWAYDAVASLAQAGIVDGYGDGKYQGDKTITRYEMAQMVAKAMARSDKADAAQKAAIDKLSVEFASELEGLNVRVTKLEKNASSVKVTGEVRVRYENTDNTPTNVDSSHSLAVRTRLALAGNINDDWTYAGRLQNDRNMLANNGAGVNSTTFDIAYVKGHLGSIETTIGRQEYMPNYGLFLDSSMDGVKFSFGSTIKANVYVGSNAGFTANAVPYGGGAAAPLTINAGVIGADFTYGISKDTNLVASVFQFKTTERAAAVATVDPESKIKLYNVGFDTKLSADWTAKGAYGQVDTDGIKGDNKAYLIGLNYKGADKTKVGSYGAFVSYRDIQKNAQVAPTFDKAVVKDGQGGKGYEVGFNYTPAANSVFTAKYVDLKCDPSGAAVEKAKLFQAQVEMFF